MTAWYLGWGLPMWVYTSLTIGALIATNVATLISAHKRIEALEGALVAKRALLGDAVARAEYYLRSGDTLMLDCRGVRIEVNALSNSHISVGKAP